MADALVKEAPLKKKNGEKEQKYLDMEFDTNIKYMFQLAEQNPVRELPVVDERTKRQVPHQKFKPYQNVVLSSQIVWNGSRVNIRYYDGCESIFVSEQPKEKDVVDQLIRQTQPRHFLEGKLGVFGDEKMLLLYLNICSWNAESPFRTRSASYVFVPVNKEAQAKQDASMLDNAEKALKLAKEASEVKMRIHAGYLGIPEIDYDSGNEYSPAEIRIEYRKEAQRNPDNFISSYGNKDIEIKYYINKALQEGQISSKANANRAAWKTGKEIIDISGLKSHEAISQKLFEFSQTEDGIEFLTQLQALYKS